MTHTYDGRLRLGAIESGTDVSEVRAYDTTDRLTTVTRGTQRDVLDYDPDGRLTSLLRVIDPGSPESPVTAIEWQQYGYDAAGNRTFTNKLLQADRSEHYGYDNRDRLTGMDRGILSSDNSGVQTPLNHGTLANKEQWVNLDRRGNWADYRETIGTGSPRKETHEHDAMNGFTCIDPTAALSGYSLTCEYRPNHVTRTAGC